jgi:alanine racemase
LCGEETAKVLEDPALIEGINIVLGMSHFASSEELNDGLNDLQIARFKKITSALKIKKWSLANTSAIYQFPNDHYDLVRAGYGLYGGNPVPHTTNPMQRVVTLEARVLHIKAAKKGESVGYNTTHILEADTTLAVLALGYADGFLRALSNKGLVYFEGQPCPIRGRVSMDLTTVDIGHLKARKPVVGDMIEILGPHQSVDALAGLASTNGYEILTRLGARYKRRYIGAS